MNSSADRRHGFVDVLLVSLIVALSSKLAPVDLTVLVDVVLPERRPSCSKSLVHEVDSRFRDDRDSSSGSKSVEVVSSSEVLEPTGRTLELVVLPSQASGDLEGFVLDGLVGRDLRGRSDLASNPENERILEFGEASWPVRKKEKRMVSEALSTRREERSERKEDGRER